jgi:hypothetical protein
MTIQLTLDGDGHAWRYIGGIVVAFGPEQSRVEWDQYGTAHEWLQDEFWVDPTDAPSVELLLDLLTSGSYVGFRFGFSEDEEWRRPRRAAYNPDNDAYRPKPTLYLLHKDDDAKSVQRLVDEIKARHAALDT